MRGNMSTPLSPLRNLLLELLRKNNAPAPADQTQQQPYPTFSATAPVQGDANSYYRDTISNANSGFATASPTAVQNPNPATLTAKPVNLYYVDSISKAPPVTYATVIPAKAASVTTTSSAPTLTASPITAPIASLSASPSATASTVPTQPKSRIEIYYEQLSIQIDEELQKEEKDFDKLRNTIDKVIMMLLRLSAVADQERIFEIIVKVKNQAVEIQGTYNKWQGMSITVISAGISITAAVAGLTPLLPSEVISANIAQTLASASMQIGTMSTGLSGFGSLFTNREEGNRTVYQVYLKKYQDQEEEKKGSKHGKTDLMKSVNNTAHENLRNRHDAVRSVLGG